MDIKEFLNFFDFDYEKYEDGYGLIDLQGANLGSIESERFSTIQEIVGRFYDSIYIPDYLTDDIEEQSGKTFSSYEEMYKWCKENENEYAGKILYALLNPETVTETVELKIENMAMVYLI